ncbi:hypothetical protein D3C75_937490 [compost metagenome]
MHLGRPGAAGLRFAAACGLLSLTGAGRFVFFGSRLLGCSRSVRGLGLRAWGSCRRLRRRCWGRGRNRAFGSSRQGRRKHIIRHCRGLRKNRRQFSQRQGWGGLRQRGNCLFPCSAQAAAKEQQKCRAKGNPSVQSVHSYSLRSYIQHAPGGWNHDL